MQLSYSMDASTPRRCGTSSYDCLKLSCCRPACLSARPCYNDMALVIRTEGWPGWADLARAGS